MSVTQLAPGSLFAGYRIDEEIGRGGMGVVYRATDLDLERPVALKRLAPELADDEGFRKRFLRESRLAASLDHGNVIPVYEAGEHEGHLFIAMRFVKGSELKTMLAKERRLPPERALAICSQVASALDGAHRRGLVHRDVKPGNVLLDQEDHVYLTDFGLTKQVGGASTQTGQLVGTLDYLAPEQIRGEALDGRTDEYALACVLYECLAGKPPFRRQTEAEVLWAHMQEVPPSLPDYPPLDQVLQTGLAKDKEERYASCAELVDAAREALGFETQRLRRRRRLIRRSRMLLGAGAAIVAAAAVATMIELTTVHGQQRISVRPNSLAVIDPRSGRVQADVAVGLRPSRVAVEGNNVWVLNADDRTISRVDASTHHVRTVSVGGNPSDLAAGAGAVWVVQSAARVTVYRIDPTTMTADRIELPGRFPYGGGNQGRAFIAYGEGAVWVTRLANGGGVLWRIDPVSGIVKRIAGPNGPLAVGAGGVWVPSGASLTKVDPHTLSVVSTQKAPFDVPSGPALGAGQLWVPDVANVHNAYTANAGTLWDVDLSTGNETRIVVGGGAVAAAFGSGAVWVACPLSGTVVRVDPSTEAAVQTIHFDGMPSGLAFGKNGLWVSVS